MASRKSRAPFKKPDYQILEDHMVFRNAKVDRSGVAVTGELFDRNCNNFCKMVDSGEIKDLGNHLYERTTKEGYCVPEKFEFDLSQDIIMAPVHLFGCENLFVSINAEEYLKYHMTKVKYNKLRDSKNRSTVVNYPVSNRNIDDSHINVCHIGKAVGDIPLKLGVNSHVSRIIDIAPYTEPYLDVMLHIGAVQNLTAALNYYYRESEIDSCAFFDIMRIEMTDDEWYDEEEYGESEDHFNKIQDAITHGERIEPDDIVNLINPMDHKPLRDVDMIVHFSTNEYRCFKGYLNPIEGVSDRWSVYIRIPGTNVWQLLNQDQYDILKRVEKLNVVYSRVDKPRFFEKVFYSTDHSANSLPDILRLCTLLCLDLDYTYFTDKVAIREYSRRIFTSIFKSVSDDKDKSYLIPADRQTYEALTIAVEQYGVIADVTLTQKELGINEDRFSYTVKNNPTGSRLRNDFCLINLVIRIADLQYSMVDDHNGPHRYRPL